MNTRLANELIHLLSHELGNEICFIRMQLDELRQDIGVAHSATIEQILAGLNRIDNARTTLKEPLGIIQYLPISDRIQIDFLELVQDIIDEKTMVFNFLIRFEVVSNNKSFNLLGDYGLFSSLVEKLLNSAYPLNHVSEPVLVSLVHQQQFLEFSIKIKNNSLPDLDQETVLEPFGLKTKHDPYGLCLYTAKLIVDFYKGDISVTCDNNSMQYKVSLPLVVVSYSLKSDTSNVL